MQLKDSVCEFCPKNQFSDGTGRAKNVQFFNPSLAVINLLKDHHFVENVATPSLPVYIINGLFSFLKCKS